MLAKKYRFNRKQVSFVLRRSRKINFSDFSVKFYPNRLNYLRLAAIVSAKTSKKATERNFWRRAIYDSFQNLKDSRGLDILISLYHLPEDKKEFQAKLREAIGKISV